MRELMTVIKTLASEVGEDVLVVAVALMASWLLAVSWLPTVALVPLGGPAMLAVVALGSAAKKWGAR